MDTRLVKRPVENKGLTPLLPLHRQVEIPQHLLAQVLKTVAACGT